MAEKIFTVRIESGTNWNEQISALLGVSVLRSYLTAMYDVLRKISPPESGEFQLGYRVLRNGSWDSNRQILARAEHLFALVRMFPEEFTKESLGERRIIAAGTTWPDSHGVSDEMFAVCWDPYYRNPGPALTILHDYLEPPKSGDKLLVLV